MDAIDPCKIFVMFVFIPFSNCYHNTKKGFSDVYEKLHIVNLPTLQPGSVSGALGGGNLNKLLFSIMFSRWLMSRAFFWIWFTSDSNLAIACMESTQTQDDTHAHTF